MKKIRLTAILTIAFIAFFSNIKAQQNVLTPRITDSTHIAVITLKDGSTIKGKIIKIEGGGITVVSSVGTVIIENRKIDNITENPNTKNIKTFVKRNADNTRLVIAPTGYMLKKGEADFLDFYLFVIGFNYGVTDNISLGVFGIPPIFSGLLPYFALTPKIGTEINENIHVAVGGYLTLGEFDIGYGAVTFGQPDANVTIGEGVLLQPRIAPQPATLLGGSWRVSNSFGFVTENYFTFNNNAIQSLISAGVRFYEEKITYDLGVWSVPVQFSGPDNAYIAIPYGGLLLKF